MLNLWIPRILGFLPEAWRWIRRREFKDSLDVSPLPLERVDALLAEIQTTEPAIARLRQIPMDLITKAVDGFLIDTDTPKTDQAIQRALRTIAARNALGPMFVETPRL